MKPLRIVVTGATGGLGRTACEMLLQRAWRGVSGYDNDWLCQPVDVVATGRRVQNLGDLQSRGLQVVPLDLACARMPQLRALVRGADAVWHCAALSSPWGAEQQFFNANVLATLRLLEAVRVEQVARFVHVSTPALYFDFSPRLDVREDAALPGQFVNAYARTKHMAERAVQGAAQRSAGALTAAILRPRALFGENDQVLLPRLLRVAQLGGGRLRLPRGGATMLDLTYLDNVVDALWLATFAELAQPASVFNITNEAPVPLRDALGTLCQHLPCEQRFDIRAVPYSVASAWASAQEWVARFTNKEPALTRYSVGALAYDMTLNVDKARAQLGWNARVPLEQALARTGQALSLRSLSEEAR